ncbi:phosphoribosylformylglycinamidine synthase [Ekhidna lutea]|uniref:Phosphoribosylformylglycinamidine synthase n=1 Tax=Ekhidna lutea TaxID=447679 RepID=A0A239LIM1_EKHLU|nr:phosphoribosylformylglycinamidine synthase [Ekhidna lutea]SNT30130.1 phosphoribosylformylglycinamidine synthase [Ekhidna lutea]
MIQFFQNSEDAVIAVGVSDKLSSDQINKLTWLFSGAKAVSTDNISGKFIGPRKEMISPWSTNASDIAHNAGIETIYRIETYISETSSGAFDPMLQQVYEGLDQSIFTLDRAPQPIEHIHDIAAYNQQEGLALSQEEIEYLDGVAKEIERPLTDSEVFGFSQINSEHCRHKIFNGTFIIDGQEQELSLFQWIKKTSKEHPNYLVSAYKDNVAFIQGPKIEQFAPATQDKPDWFDTKEFESVISLKAETHNFPTTVEPFNGAATGSGGEIRDRMAGGQGSIPLAGTAVYMTSYSRTEEGRGWEKSARKWLYQTPQEILTKASNGASDYGNKFGQPLICGSVLTFEHEEGGKKFGYDKVIMQAGGVGYGKKKDAQKKHVKAGEKIVVMGGDNYRIGMGGSAVSSVDTGAFNQALELNAVQRSNPEMQKRVANAVRAMVELEDNTITSIHDHGAGGHLNCLSELVEETGGTINLKKLPVGDETLSAKEVLGNESQERMGLVIKEQDAEYLKRVSERERAPYYEVGEAGDNNELKFENNGEASPFDLKLHHLFGSSPKTILEDKTQSSSYEEVSYAESKIEEYLEAVLQLEAVACKDWLTNKVDRCVTGRVATQQTCGELQLPLNNVAVMALDFKSNKGIATSIGHSPVPGLINAGAGSRLSITEALANLVWAPLTHGLKGVSLSANWMWPAKNEGENARLYEGVKAISDFACELGINVPTGKDSMSMTQKYPDGEKVYAPGTVIISSVGEVSDINKTVSPTIDYRQKDSKIIYLDFSGSDFELGGSSFAQSQSKLGVKTPEAKSEVVALAFNTVQELINQGLVIAGHDISAGGLITALLEMNFPNTKGGLDVDLSSLGESDTVRVLFSEKPGVLLQVEEDAIKTIENSGLKWSEIGKLKAERSVSVTNGSFTKEFDIKKYQSAWFKPSALLDLKQTKPEVSQERTKNRFSQPLSYSLPKQFDGKASTYNLDFNRKGKSGVKAAIIREQGVNSDREMAYALWLAGFDVKDVHMTDLITGREDLSEVNLIVFVGGFSNSDVLGSAKGWAGSFLFNEKAKAALDAFYAREDTLSLGVCNGCQLMMELGLIYPEMGDDHPKMYHNSSEKFECGFVSVDIKKTNSIMLESMVGSKLGIWLAHGEGRFMLENESDYKIPVKYSSSEFPGNTNGSSFDTAALCSEDGRHLAIMPHLERSLFAWNWPYKQGLENAEVSPWMEPFANAFEWVKNK